MAKSAAEITVCSLAVMTHTFSKAAALVSGSLAACSVLAACGAATTAPADAAPSHARPSTHLAAHVHAVARPASPRVTITRVTSGDGSLVTLATFRGPVEYVLHDGSEDPYVPSGELRDTSAVTGTERHRLLAAFNGGFKMNAGAGGYEQEGHVISPLRRGLASLTIDRSGRAAIGVWGRGLPARGESVYSVRQNLQPLVLDGKPTDAAYDWGLWGVTLGGGEYVARSALGEDADGDLIYAGSMSTTPYDLAQALARSGARTAMELDINPAWVQLDVASRPGGALRAEVYRQYRPADQYLYGWTRDFVTVLGEPGRPLPAIVADPVRSR
jgi:hypothetical protein